MAGWVLSFVCSTGLRESCKNRTLRLQYRQKTSREETQRETTCKDFLVFMFMQFTKMQVFCM